MGPRITEDVSAAALAGYDMVIDVRSPGEFAEDHVPGAVNLPVLSNEERALVGTVYVQEDRFLARRRGAALVARNIAMHLETALADKGGAFRPLVYCWRGGMRSNAMAHILTQVGWRTDVLAGGYKTYRRQVTRRLYDEALDLRFVLIDGQTGSGKTDLLGRLAARGVQVLDLEGLAAHRGSLFGAFADRPQPSQKLFESRLLGALDGLDPARVVVAEAESSKIGERMIPPALWTRMSEAPRIDLAVGREARADYLVTAYADLIADPAALEAGFARLPTRPSAERLAAWRAWVAAGDYRSLADALMTLHYDPAYERSRKKQGRRLLEVLDVVPADPADQDRCAARIAEIVSALDGPDARRDSEPNEQGRGRHG